MTKSDPYSSSRVARGIVHLFGGKAITSIAGIGTFLLLVRTLPIEHFAAYSVLLALVELVDVVTGVGLSHVLSRYVPELFVSHRHVALQRLIAVTLALRVVVLGIFLTAIYFLAPKISPLIGLADWGWAVQFYLAVVLIRVVSASLFSVLESMLHQAIAQLGLALVNVLRFVLIALATNLGALDLKMVIVIELVTELIGFIVMLVGIIRVMPGGIQAEEEGTGWIRRNFARMRNFAVRGYLQHLLIMPYGGAVNRLLVGGALSNADVALFGFAQSIADMMERYLPVKLLAGVIRPVLTARYVRDRRFSELVFAANLIFKINAIAVGLAAVMIYSGGYEMLTVVTNGKYGDEGVALLLLICALVAMYSLRHMLDHVSHAVERNGPLVWSNLVIACSMLPGIATLPTLGVYAMPAANLMGLVAGSLVLVWRLRVGGFPFRYDVAGLARLLVVTAIGFGIGDAARWFGAAWPMAMAAGGAAFVGAAFAIRVLSVEERRQLRSIISRR